jgi:hypothetical protein
MSGLGQYRKITNADRENFSKAVEELRNKLFPQEELLKGNVMKKEMRPKAIDLFHAGAPLTWGKTKAFLAVESVKGYATSEKEFHPTNNSGDIEHVLREMIVDAMLFASLTSDIDQSMMLRGAVEEFIELSNKMEGGAK